MANYRNQTQQFFEQLVEARLFALENNLMVPPELERAISRVSTDLNLLNRLESTSEVIEQ